MSVWLGEPLESVLAARDDWSADALDFARATRADSRAVRARALARALVLIAADLDAMRLT
ncbi:MAG: hypothetical protein ABTD50_13760 [Polyangiaceae bacterium]